MRGDKEVFQKNYRGSYLITVDKEPFDLIRKVALNLNQQTSYFGRVRVLHQGVA